MGPSSSAPVCPPISSAVCPRPALSCPHLCSPQCDQRDSHTTGFLQDSVIFWKNSAPHKITPEPLALLWLQCTPPRSPPSSPPPLHRDSPAWNAAPLPQRPWSGQLPPRVQLQRKVQGSRPQSSPPPGHPGLPCTAIAVLVCVAHWSLGPGGPGGQGSAFPALCTIAPPAWLGGAPALDPVL